MLQVWFGRTQLLQPHMVHSSIVLICESERLLKNKFGAGQQWPQKGHYHQMWPAQSPGSKAADRGHLRSQQPLTHFRSRHHEPLTALTLLNTSEDFSSHYASGSELALDIKPITIPHAG